MIDLIPRFIIEAMLGLVLLAGCWEIAKMLWATFKDMWHG